MAPRAPVFSFPFSIFEFQFSRIPFPASDAISQLNP